MQRFLLCLMLLFWLGGCTSATFTRTGDLKSTGFYNDNCEFAVYTIPPERKYEEVGVIEMQGPYGPPAKIADVKKLARKDVCVSGGNGLLLWEANGLGQYSKATVIRFKE